MLADKPALCVPGSVQMPGAIAAAARVLYVVLDVDGVCTDGKLYTTREGDVIKSFHSHDGIAIKTAFKAGLGIGVITGRNDPSVHARMTQLGITDYYAGHDAKLSALLNICARHGLTPAEMAYVGDDWIDLDPMRAVGMPMAVANARVEVKDEALYVTAAAGGEGAVREAIEFLLTAGNEDVNLADLWTVKRKAELPGT